MNVNVLAAIREGSVGGVRAHRRGSFYGVHADPRFQRQVYEHWMGLMFCGTVKRAAPWRGYR